MKTVKAIIETNDEGFFSIYLPDIKGVYGAGETEQEAKNELLEAIDIYNDHCVEIGEKSELASNYELCYYYELSGFFHKFDFLDLTAVAKRINKNPSLLRQYKRGKPASENQKKEIIEGIKLLCKEIQEVKY